ncbi:MAG: complex I subunit 5 family protein [Anaerolineales bacterium]|jgi:multicomponent Na+:H+ antiporter subunit D
MEPRQLILLPVLIPLTGAFLILLLRPWKSWQRRLAFFVMLVSLLCSFWLLLQVWQSKTAAVYHLGGWVAPYGISLVADPLSTFMVLMSQLVLLMGIIYSMGARDKAIQYPTFYPLFLCLAVGLTGAFLSGDLFNLFVFAELLVISGTVLTAISDDRYGAEAAYKYYYISLLASTFLLLAIGCLYISYGSLNLADLAMRIRLNPAAPLLPVAIGLLSATFMVKSAVFPFHFWQPDFHSASSTPVSAMLSSVVVKLGIYGFLRMTTLLFVQQSLQIRILLISVGIFSVFFGGLSAIGTHNAKRMLAYSTLAQVGFILVGISWNTPLSIAAALVFAFNHSLIKSAMLMLAGSVASRTGEKSAAFDILMGTGKHMPFAGLLFFIGGLALAGIPPTNGFISKYLIFNSGAALGEYAVLILLGLGGVLSLIYTMRAFQKIWWLPKKVGSSIKPEGDRLIAPAVLIVLILAFGIWAEPLVQISQTAGVWLQDPMNYLQAVLGPAVVMIAGG